MWSSSLGDAFRIVTFGESHGPAVGVVIDGVRPGQPLDTRDIQAELDRRRPGQSSVTTARREPDRAEILSGVFEGLTTGAPICIIVRSVDARSKDYERIRDLFRPGHGDLTWLAKYGIRDWRGGGRLSGRETVGRVAAGAVARQLLAEAGVSIRGHVTEAGGVRARTYDPVEAGSNAMRCGDPDAAGRMRRAVEAAHAAGDSVGAVVQVEALDVPAGWGDPVFGKLDARLAGAMMSIGAVKGVEVGAGFAAARMRGSAHNDPIRPDGFESNHAGGVLGGISSGADVVLRLAVKPTSSIAHEQATVDVSGRAATIQVRGRHDPCIGPRLVPVAEAMMAIVLADAFLQQQAISGAEGGSELALEHALARAEDDLAYVRARRDALAARIDDDRGEGEHHES